MRIAVKTLSAGAWCLCAIAAFAQQAPPAEAPATDASAKPANAEVAPAKAAKAAPAATAQAEAGEPRANTIEKAPPSPTRTAPATGQKANAADKLQLGTATVTGDREQPKVMYVVPWKHSDIGDLGGKPMNSLVDEILAPVDRDVFKREVRYYQTVKSDASQNGAQPPGQGEK